MGKSGIGLTLAVAALYLSSCATVPAPAAPVPGANAPAQANAHSMPGAGNPLFGNRFTADPAPLVTGDRLYLYAGHDQGDEGFDIREWVVYSTDDLRTWTDHGVLMRPTDFGWAKGEAWASQMVERDGAFYFYVTVEHDESHPGKAIGVARCDTPVGPCRDARGSALVQDNPATWRTWSEIDPTVFVDDDGTAWLAWGNSNLYLARLKPNMTEIDGPIEELHLTNFLEGPWLHKHDGLYYMTYASFIDGEQTSEHISYSTAPSLSGPWTYRGELTGAAANSFTIHAGIEQFRGQWLFFYHDGTAEIDGVSGGEFRRSVAAEPFTYNADGTIAPIRQTREGLARLP